MIESSSDRDPIEKLAESFVARFRAGERPSIEEYTSKYPDLADEIRELLPALVRIEQDLSVAGDTPVAAQQRHVVRGAPRQLGDYLILREIGRGGMGVVYEAVQQSLGRHVALKVMPWQSVGSTSQLERFNLEARAAARLHHSNIVPVFGVGECDGMHYYAMQYIQGQGLDLVYQELRKLRKSEPPAPAAPERGSAIPQAQTMAQRLITGRLVPIGEPAATRGVAHDGDAELTVAEADQPSSAADPDATQAAPGDLEATIDHVSTPRNAPSIDPQSASSVLSSRSELSGSSHSHYFRGVARIGLQVAEALAYAHSQGILHRDIKPSNLLIDTRGCVWVTDFGLAKSEGSEGPTQTGDIIGTLRYMSPERFDGWSDRRSDVYSLGATLYELATLQPLFDEPNRGKLIDRVLKEEPAAPRKIDDRVPRDLETIILKALAKEPASRYADADRLADDLRRFINDQPIAARRISQSERLARWARRNPWVAGLAAAFAVALTVGLVGVTLQWRRAESEKDRANKLLSQSERDRTAAQDASLLAQAQRREAVKQTGLAEEQRKQADANFARARAAVDEYFTKVSDNKLLAVPGMQTLRADLLRSALAFYEDFIKTRGDDPSLRAALAAVYLKAARIRSELGESNAAVDDYRAALRLYNALLGQQPNDPEAQAGMADACLGIVQARASVTGDFTSSEAQSSSYLLSKAIRLRVALAAAKPGDDKRQRDLAHAYLAQGTRNLERGHVRDALSWFMSSRDIASRLVEQAPDDPENQIRLAGTLGEIANCLCRLDRHKDESIVRPAAITHARHAYELAPGVLDYGLGYAELCMRDFGNLASQERWSEAHRLAVQTIELVIDLIRRNPDVPGPSHMLDQVYRQAIVHARAHDAGWPLAEREAAYEELRALTERFPRDRPAQALDYASTMLMLATRNALFDINPDKVQTERDRAAALHAVERVVSAGYDDVERVRGIANFPDIKGEAAWRTLVARAEENRSRGANSISGVAPRNKPMRDGAGSVDELVATQQAVGMIQQGLGEYSAAVQTLRQAALGDVAVGKRVTSLLSLAYAEWMAGDWGAAMATWKRVEVDFDAARADARDDREATVRLKLGLRAFGGALGQAGAWDEARRVAALMLEQQSLFDFYDARDGMWHHLAAIFLAAGDLERYRQACRLMDQAFSDDGDVDQIESLVHVATLAPDPGLDRAHLSDLAEGIFEKQPLLDWVEYAHAAALYRAGRYKDADDQLRALINSNPLFRETGVALLLGALIDWRLGHTEEAHRQLRAAEALRELIVEPQLEPHEGTRATGINWWVWAGFEAMRREAHEVIEGKQPPDGPVALLWKAQSAARLGRGELAARHLAAARTAIGDDRRLTALSERIARQAQRDNDATGGSWPSARPREANPQLQDAFVLLEIGDDAGARRALDRALADNPTNARDLLVLQGHLWRGGRNEEARALEQRLVAATVRESQLPMLKPLTPALEDKPTALGHAGSITFVNLRRDSVTLTSTRGDNNRGPWHTIPPGGRVEFGSQATHDLHPWLVKDSRGAPLAMFYAKKGGGIAVISESMDPSQNEPDDPRLLPAWCECLLEEGQIDRALDVFEKAANALPGDARLAYQRSRAMSAAGRASQSDAEFRRALDIGAADSEQLRRMGLITGGEGQWEMAAALYDRALQADPSNHWNWYLRGPIYLLMGDRDGFRRHCRAMIERFGDATDPGIQERNAKVCALDPRPAVEVEQLIKIADRGLRGAGDSPYQPYFIATRAFVEVRAPHASTSQMRNAVERILLKANYHSDTAQAAPETYEALAHALAAAYDGDLATAREKLAQVQGLLGRPDGHCPASYKNEWWDWACALVLYREAQGLVLDAAFPAAAFAP